MRISSETPKIPPAEIVENQSESAGSPAKRRLNEPLIHAIGYCILFAFCFSGFILLKNSLAHRLSTRGQAQLSSLTFLFVCGGLAVGIWLLCRYVLETFIQERQLKAVMSLIQKSSKRPWGLALLTLLLFLTYREAVHFTFFGDEFRLLSLVSKGGFSVILPMKQIYHYFPMNLLIIGIPRWLGIGQPLTYHLMNIVVHSINVVLVYMIALDFLKSRYHAFGAGLMFAFFFLNYDPVLWNYYMVATMFALLSFLFFLRFHSSGKRSYFFSYVVFYILAIYTQEVMIPLILICILYHLTHPRDSLVSGTTKRLLSALPVYIIPVIFLSVLWLIKYFFTARIVVAHNEPLKILQNSLSAACFLMPFNNMSIYWLFSIGGQNLFFMGALTLLGVLFLWWLVRRGSRNKWLMLAWVVAFTIPVVTISEPSPRYIYVAAVGWSIFWAFVIRDFAGAVSKWSFFKRQESGPLLKDSLAFIAAGLLYVCIALQGVRHARLQMDIWEKGSVVIRGAVSSTVQLMKEHPEKRMILVVDQPTYLEGNDFFGVPLVFGSMAYAVEVLYDLPAQLVIKSVKLHVNNLFDKALPTISPGEIGNILADPDALIIRYDCNTMRMSPLTSISE